MANQVSMLGKVIKHSGQMMGTAGRGGMVSRMFSSETRWRVGMGEQWVVRGDLIEALEGVRVAEE